MHHTSIKSAAWLILACVVFITVTVFGQARQAASSGSADAKKLRNPVSVTAQSVAAGQQVFQKYCRFCHGEGGKGDGTMIPKGMTPSNLTDETWNHGSSDGEIFMTIRDGVGPKYEMKGHKDRINEREIWHVVNYLRSLGPKTKAR